MATTIYQLCAHANNWFEDKKIIGDIEISGGRLNVDTENYKYIRIIGSNDNDGVYEVSQMTLTDESFDGAVWLLKIPKPFVELSSKIAAWMEANGGKELYQSESFGGYSYTRNPDSLTWQGAFKSEIDQWRKKR